ncbi:hypothetical protein BBK36DRAFT_1124308 [Trichoderma citrinoviride]|uniref:Myb-like domain-containing protein n=1 Tax=Trichoderma citrinoviride TaxID=58853 RepID=A0A2T4B4A8_9HYPO|nr:hypothetical protein BBK36DRAFT_1124308 [Trichoderma citrinoviride]PTB64166.1 hypothetical protein BBK36DRAFT_1124308 [Trichoderma citrinoviride]
MLLPSAFSCDGGAQATPLPRSQPTRFASPPSSPSTLSAQYSIDSIMNTCRSLQSLISMTASGADQGALAPAPTLTQLPTPPLAHAPTPMKLRLRARPVSKTADGKGGDETTPVARKRIARRAPPRGANKRRRADSDDMGRDDDYCSSSSSSSSDMDTEAELDAAEALRNNMLPPFTSSSPQAPSTPKRARISPEQLPLGLERADFHNVHLLEGGDQSARKPGTDVQVEADGAEWSVEDDRVLVELVLEKLKLSKMEWQDCARSLGKDRHSVNRRWKSLVMNGDIGVKTRSRRARIHSTWRC